jgi:heme oxygenase
VFQVQAVKARIFFIESFLNIIFQKNKNISEIIEDKQKNNIGKDKFDKVTFAVYVP